ncbi:malectin domain-containing carbohydrate-binding protein [Rufibacter tibetensis]|uniref:malectin domain-containing carbohydrate-binding protein n=1 Tax=Rufibacter tibetensis TaxID=512763 RepID=UPI000784E98B|nr:malectin domain-containing carbohydrate-binding protein [Rufibacter tibetensis]
MKNLSTNKFVGGWSYLIFFTFYIVLSPTLSVKALAQTTEEKPKTEKKLKAKLPPEDLSGAMLANAQFNFSTSGLKNITIDNPTSLQFGPDGRLYVSQQYGLIHALTIVRNGANNYSVTAQETINLINLIPNHDDNGALAPGWLTTRQITSILVTGTAANPILYVTSSDSRIGGPGGDQNLDTNSGIVSKLTKSGGIWTKIDLVRGLPRSEENHSTNGMQLDEAKNILYLALGGNTNAGSPSVNFAYLTEFALSAAILSIDLNAINAMTTKVTGNNAYKYDLPTLDDPTRTNENGVDVGDPFGGNDGLNQAKLVPGGPVQIYSPGFRNSFDIVITKTPGKAGRMYTIDNGANQGWGGYPDKEGPNGTATNNYLSNEPGSTSPGVNDPVVNNKDNLHYIGNTATYVPGSHYGGHPNPIRANPAGAGIYTHNGSSGVWRTSTSGSNPLPVDWPPVPLNKVNPIEGDFQMPGTTDQALLTFDHSTNGIAEYTASNFNSGLKGSLLAASFSGDIFRITPTEDGTNVTNSKTTTEKVNTDLPFASGFGSQPLDVTTQGDNDIFPGTVWATTYGTDAITVFEPQELTQCTGGYTASDEDTDGYTNMDEIDNATNPCSSSSMPPDQDGDKKSDLNDPDDDNDGLYDNVDYFPLDATNGVNTTLPINYELFNNDPGTGFFGIGFTGLMSNGQVNNDYYNLYFDENLIAGGAVGAFSVVEVSTGDALGTLNNQENAFQFGFKANASAYTVHGRTLGSFFNGKTPSGFQSQGIFIGKGDQDNYLKIVLNANGGLGGIEVVYENEGVVKSVQYPLTGGLPTSSLDFYLSVNPVTGVVQPKYAKDGGAITLLGSPIQLSGSLLTTIQGANSVAAGIISTSRGGTPFTATWDFIKINYDNQPPVQQALYRLNAGGGALNTSLGTFSADQYYSGGGTYTSGSAIANTSDDALYQTERYGWGQTLSYAIPLTSGQYKVVLHFAEVFFQSAGQRVFDVFIEGGKVLDNYDITKKVGAQAAVTETFTVSVTDGTLSLYMSALAADGGVDNPKISGIEVFSGGTTPPDSPPVANAGPDQTITLPVSSVTLSGSGTSSSGPITAFEWAQVSGPNTAAFSSKTVASPTVSGLIAGDYVFSLKVTSSGGVSPADQVAVKVNPQPTTQQAVYRINAGSGALSTSIGAFSADQYFSGGATHATGDPISNTTDDALYQSERWASGSLSYAMPVASGQYKVVLHFAEIYFQSAGQRVFDVFIEGVKVLDNYDITGKVGSRAAITETFNVSVTDGTLNVLLSSVAAEGGVENPKISGIEVFSGGTTPPDSPPVANAGPDQTITLPVSNVTLSGSGTSSSGPITAFEWAQVSGPNTAAFSSKTVASPTVSGLIAGDYVFSLKVTSSGGVSPADQVAVKVNPQPTTQQAVYRINAGGGALSTSIGAFSADQFFSGVTYTYFGNKTITGTPDSPLYQTERSGDKTLTYAMPIASGQYRVVLHFAELLYNKSGKRIFDVFLEGNKVLDNYDIAKKVGWRAAVTETFTVNVTDGTLDLRMSSLPADGGIDNPKISAIEVYKVVSGTSSALMIEPVAGHQEQPKVINVNVYPNPFDDAVHVKVTTDVPQQFKIKVFDIIGRQLFQREIELQSAGSQSINLDFGENKIPRRGINFVEVESNDKSFRKVIKLVRNW